MRKGWSSHHCVHLVLLDCTTFWCTVWKWITLRKFKCFYCLIQRTRTEPPEFLVQHIYCSCKAVFWSYYSYQTVKSLTFPFAFFSLWLVGAKHSFLTRGLRNKFFTLKIYYRCSRVFFFTQLSFTIFFHFLSFFSPQNSLTNVIFKTRSYYSLQLENFAWKRT